jgi:membrane protein YqaA with SNARE-associated domain
VSWKDAEHSSNKFYPTGDESAIFDCGVRCDRELTVLISSPRPGVIANSVTIRAVFPGDERRMHPHKLPLWLQHLVGTMGGGGLFLVAFLDSSVLSFPLVTDALVIQLSFVNPKRMPYYAGMAAVGSIAGCIWLYLLAKKGGEAFFHRHAGGNAETIKNWVDRNGFLSIFIPAILPPPLPFKPFVLAEGVFQVPMRTFMLGVLLGRSLRYGAEGILAVLYGDAALDFLIAHSRAFALSVVGILVVLYIATHLTFRQSPAKK